LGFLFALFFLKFSPAFLSLRTNERRTPRLAFYEHTQQEEKTA